MEWGREDRAKEQVWEAITHTKGLQKSHMEAYHYRGLSKYLHVHYKNRFTRVALKKGDVVPTKHYRLAK